MIFARLENGVPVVHSYAHPIENPDGSKTVSSNAEFLASRGIYPVERTDAPDVSDGYRAVCGWELRGGRIVETWTVTAADGK